MTKEYFVVPVCSHSHTLVAYVNSVGATGGRHGLGSSALANLSKGRTFLTFGRWPGAS